MTDEKTEDANTEDNSEDTLKNINITKLIKYGKIGADALSLHHLLHKIPNDNIDEKMKIVSGITGYGIGYLIGPQIHASCQHIKNGELHEILQKQEIITATGGLAGVVAGAIIVNYSGKFNLSEKQAVEKTTNGQLAQLPAQNITAKSASQKKHSNIIDMTATGASIAWLAYSIGSGGSYEEKLRHRYGLITGTIGYFTPKLLNKLGIVNNEAPTNKYSPLIILGLGVVGTGIAHWQYDNITKLLSKKDK